MMVRESGQRERGHAAAMFIDQNLLAQARSRSRSCSKSFDCWLLTAGEDLREMGSDGTEGVYDVMFDAAALEAYASIHYVHIDIHQDVTTVSVSGYVTGRESMALASCSFLPWCWSAYTSGHGSRSRPG